MCNLVAHFFLYMIIEEQKQFLKNKIEKLKLKYRKRYRYAVSLKKNKYLRDQLDLIFPQLKSSFFKVSTKIYWLEHDMTDFLKCTVCRKSIFKNIYDEPSFHCSKHCAAIDKATLQKTENTNMKKYGVKYMFQCEKSLKNIRKSIIEKYGGKTGNIWSTDFGKQQCIKTKFQKNNGNYENNETIEKRKNTIKSKYGGTTGNIFGTEQGKKHIKETNLMLYRKEHFNQTSSARKHLSEILQSISIQTKINETKRKNGSFNISKSEEKSYEILCRKYGNENIIRQYKSEKYPFLCDFYVKSLDLYIECNFSWTHGGMFFDENNENCIQKLNVWKEKAKTSRFYENALKTWTIRDIKKLKTAQENKLNYKVFWTLDEFEKYFSENF